MAKVNTSLKRVFTIFNVFFAIIGALIIMFTLTCHVLTNRIENIQSGSSGLILLYVIGTITMVIAILGAYGAHKENKACLIVFLVCMVIGTLLMMRSAVPTAVIRPQVKDLIESKFRDFLPLDHASYQAQNIADEMQKELHCCGLDSYNDWEGNIPDSCLCDPEVEEEGACQTVGYKSFMNQQKSIYTKTCLPIIVYYAELVCDIAIGITFTLLVLALLGMILSSIIIHQLRYPDSPTILMTVPTIFTTAPPKYQELQNPPSY
ncbi:tetraspanin-8-like [Trachinotus anak]|uniref:tetraspanin-8-like n=1 Tax=Trachinotus anak TaxID=443729 RepID=UPI0039F1F8F1